MVEKGNQTTEKKSVDKSSVILALQVVLVGLMMVLVVVSVVVRAPKRWIGSMSLQELQKQYNDIHYYDLQYRQLRNGGEGGALLPLKSELTAEGKCNFSAGEIYEIRFDFPEELIAELANGQRGYEVSVDYDGAVEAGGTGYIRIMMHDQSNSCLYLAHSAFAAEDDLELRCRNPFILPNGESWPYEFSAGLEEGATPTYLQIFLQTADDDSELNGAPLQFHEDEIATWTVAAVNRA